MKGSILMRTTDYSQEILKELNQTLSNVSADEVEELAKKILDAKRVFLAGLGRSGVAVKAFAMRLMHMGLPVYVVGEIVTPAIQKGDLLVVGSGSGETGSLTIMAKKVKDIGAELALVTIFPQSTIGKLADAIVKIPAPTPKVATESGFKSIQPMGSLFEQSLLLLFDSLILRLMEIKKENSENMMKRHANLE
jgi:6-phospho-3-hexuloisomerase